MSTDIEFGKKNAADTYREEYSEYLCSEDDARLKTVTFNSDAPEHVLWEAGLDAMESRGEEEYTTGQVGLSQHERDEIDFSKGRASVPHAQAVKALAVEEGIDDWLSHYDPTLTVDEHRSTFERIRPSGGCRMDSHEERQAQRRRDAARTAQSEQCDHAKNHCQNGDPDACEFLQNVCGFEQAEIESFLDPDPEPAGPSTSGQEVTGKAAGALSRSWGGYQAAVGRLDTALNEMREAWEHAQQAGKAINAIRNEHGQGSLDFEGLEEAQAQLADLVRKAAADCHECHADHADHDHDVNAGDREDLLCTEYLSEDWCLFATHISYPEYVEYICSNGLRDQAQRLGLPH